MASVADLLASHRALRRCSTTAELLARAVGLGTMTYGFDRGVVATVVDGQLTTRGVAPLDTKPSDELRRHLLSAPVTLRPGTAESELVRRGVLSQRSGAPSDLEAALGLRAFAASAVAPETTTLALLIFDRAEPPVTDAERAGVDAFAAIVAMALERVVLRHRVADLAAEVRLFAGNAQALAQEVAEAAVALPIDRGMGSVLPHPEMAGQVADGRLMDILSPGERRTAELLVEGRSNKEIAELLVVSPETVKTHVARILRKVGAANRVEAVSRLLR